MPRDFDQCPTCRTTYAWHRDEDGSVFSDRDDLPCICGQQTFCQHCTEDGDATKCAYGNCQALLCDSEDCGVMSADGERCCSEEHERMYAESSRRRAA